MTDDVRHLKPEHKHLLWSKENRTVFPNQNTSLKTSNKLSFSNIFVKQFSLVTQLRFISDIAGLTIIARLFLRGWEVLLATTVQFNSGTLGKYLSHSPLFVCGGAIINLNLWAKKPIPKLSMTHLLNSH